MNCRNCGELNPENARVCFRCGAALREGIGLSWVAATFYALLVCIFLPIGVCGAYFVAVAIAYPPQSDYDMTFYALPFMFGIPSMLIGFGVAYLIARQFFRR